MTQQAMLDKLYKSITEAGVYYSLSEGEIKILCVLFQKVQMLEEKLASTNDLYQDICSTCVRQAAEIERLKERLETQKQIIGGVVDTERKLNTEIEALNFALDEIINSDVSQYADDKSEMIYCLQHIAIAAREKREDGKK